MCCVDDPQVPSIPVRLSLVKLFLELSLFDPALLTLQGIMASDDQEVKAWYLEDWAFYLMAELAQDSPNGKLEGDGLTWEELAKDAKDCLETCRNVGCCEDVSLIQRMLTDTIRSHITQEHGDDPILEHVDELIDGLEKKGIVATTVGGKTRTQTARTETKTLRCADEVSELWMSDVTSLGLNLCSLNAGPGRCNWKS